MEKHLTSRREARKRSDISSVSCVLTRPDAQLLPSMSRRNKFLLVSMEKKEEIPHIYIFERIPYKRLLKVLDRVIDSRNSRREMIGR